MVQDQNLTGAGMVGDGRWERGHTKSQNHKMCFFTCWASNLAEDMSNDRPERGDETDVGIWLGLGGYEVYQEGMTHVPCVGGGIVLLRPWLCFT